MNNDNFNECRKFLEKRISESEDKETQKRLIDIYEKLLQQKSQYDLESEKIYSENQIKNMELQTQQNIEAIKNQTIAYQSYTTSCTTIAQYNIAAFQNYQNQYWGALNNIVDKGYVEPLINMQQQFNRSLTISYSPNQ